jgi:hypothetical protein
MTLASYRVEGPDGFRVQRGQREVPIGRRHGAAAGLVGGSSPTGEEEAPFLKGSKNGHGGSRAGFIFWISCPIPWWDRA